MEKLLDILLSYFPRLYQEKIMAYCEEQSLNVKQQVTLSLRLVGLWEVQVFSLSELEELLPEPALVSIDETQERALNDLQAVLVDLEESARVKE